MIGKVGLDVALASLLLAFAISATIAWVYANTYQGIGYLRSFTQSIALSGVVAAIAMLAIGDDIARGLGMVGALTLIRFRATLKDPRDLMFVFASLACGVACGVQAFAAAVGGVAVFGVAAMYVSWSSFGSKMRFDAVLRFRASSEARCEESVRGVLDRHARKLSLIDLRAAGEAVQEHAYHLKLARAGGETLLLRELERIPGVDEATIVKQDATLEL
ncbi:MAG: DUF4956 domain-containing protein [Labilithrix sp.]|nr:DUF4956 domain-containing protein [Labilithrix sp.]MCW5835300.1 DUF4956 domain-containing protein [Labilithrix sp.]